MNTVGFGFVRVERLVCQPLPVIACMVFWLVASAGTADAQSIIFNNYNHTPVGEYGALQGGAVIARVNDASAA